MHSSKQSRRKGRPGLLVFVLLGLFAVFALFLAILPTLHVHLRGGDVPTRPERDILRTLPPRHRRSTQVPSTQLGHPFPRNTTPAQAFLDPPVGKLDQRSPKKRETEATLADDLQADQRRIDADEHHSSCQGGVLDHEDAQVRDHPGGTEQQAFQERRELEDRNWPLRPGAVPVWRSRPRPVFPPSLKCAIAADTSEAPVDPDVANDPVQVLERFQKLRRRHQEQQDDADTVSSPNACDTVYGLGTVAAFRTANRTLCRQRNREGSLVTCMSRRVHTSHSVDTSICRALNAAVRYDAISDGDFPWLAFHKGTFQAQCSVTSDPSHWSFMHCLNDWMGLGFQPVSNMPTCDVTVDEPTFFLTRSGDYSPFALAHDWVNAVLLYAAEGLRFNETRIVVMDRMTTGFYTPVWQRLFAPRHRLEWFPDLRRQHKGRTVCYRQAHFNIPARLSPLYNEDSCVGSALIQGAASLVAAAIGAGSVTSPANRIVVTIILRKNYGTGHHIGRRIANTRELHQELTKHDSQLLVRALDYAELDFDQQVNVSRSTDVLVGMHGAGLIHAMFLPSHGGVFEFFCPDRPSSNIRYLELSKRLDLRYNSFSLSADDGQVPVQEVLPRIMALVDKVRTAKEKRRSRGTTGRV